jgi:hypothetical protein
MRRRELPWKPFGPSSLLNTRHHSLSALRQSGVEPGGVHDGSQCRAQARLSTGYTQATANTNRSDPRHRAFFLPRHIHSPRAKQPRKLNHHLVLYLVATTSLMNRTGNTATAPVLYGLELSVPLSTISALVTHKHHTMRSAAHSPVLAVKQEALIQHDRPPMVLRPCAAAAAQEICDIW